MLVLQPEATLVAITEEARRALGGAGEVRVPRGFLSVGRERRSPLDDAGLSAKVREQRLGEASQLNDVYLLEHDHSRALHISGAHFAIECIDGLFFLTDRGSACGTIVAGRRIGGHRKAGGPSYGTAMKSLSVRAGRATSFDSTSHLQGRKTR